MQYRIIYNMYERVYRIQSRKFRWWFWRTCTTQKAYDLYAPLEFADAKSARDCIAQWVRWDAEQKREKKFSKWEVLP